MNANITNTQHHSEQMSFGNYKIPKTVGKKKKRKKLRKACVSWPDVSGMEYFNTGWDFQVRK